MSHARWERIDTEFRQLQADIDLDNYLAPMNRASELERFKAAAAAGWPYNPQFVYDSLPDVYETDLIALRDTLNAHDLVEALYLEAIDFRLGEINAARTHSAPDITRITLDMYGRPDAEVIAVARTNLAQIQPDQSAYAGSLKGRIYNAEELAEICRDAMKRYGFDWKVVVKPEMGAKAAVDNLIREFWIRADVKFHESLVKMVVVHEIGTHVLRSENGYAQPLKIFGRGLPAYQFTEEGLAEYAEEQTGTLKDDTVYRISGRVIGVDTALKGSFWDVFLAVKDYFDVEMAFDIAQRAKLGIADTSLPGAYTKDYTYLAGLLKIRRFFSSATPADLNAMFAGKVGFQHMDTVKTLQADGYLHPPAAQPEWL